MDKGYDFFEDYMNSQKKMMNMWQEYVKSFGGNNFNPINNEYFSSFTKIFGDIGSADFFNYSGTPTEVVQKIKETSKLYYSIYELYKNIYDKDIEPTKENLERIMKQYKEGSLQYINNYIFPYIPVDLQNLIKQCMGAAESYKNMIIAIYGPWMDNSSELMDYVMKGVFDDPKAFLEFFKLWKKNYSETFGKMLNAPQFGIDRNTYEMQMKTIDKMITFIGNYLELSIMISNLINESTENVVKESFEMIKEGKAPKTYEEFYNYWKAKTSEEFDTLFYSDEFSKFLGNFVDSLMLLKIDLDRVIEESLKWVPIPTNSDMDSLYKTVYELKKEVRNLKRHIRDKEYEEEKKENK
ncbi:poly(R)-hydroxyalkanoic acid synthase [Peptoniphilus sp. AGMB00490]|uniref:Poly(R)-hydroxyalkanoic acid synthase n=2 Tax=Peptoniphilus TaxID=162289 RepID=A0ACD6B036_9FIRM|nr:MULTISPECIES: poly(R)-hydroxyalkanoic acid synthase subunit PhaE [Peptoniphilus]NMW84817.1 poly(R)-hydroxyalkanoic acid synthase [Peptoniphilus faecalis]OLR65700.1 poly(R)-hydroxyalkanoic acid synthase [Peptoniphilus porci]